jgi:outer membrane protein insertion porin family
MSSFFLIFLIFSSLSSPIGKIRIIGNHSFKEKELIRILGIKKGEPFRPSLLKSSLLRLENFYKGKGFFDVSIESTKVEKRKGKIYVSIYVKEGRRRYIGGISFKGAESIDSTKLLKFFGLSPPYPFDVDVLGEGESRVLEEYAERGFPFVEISREDDLRGDTLFITYHIEEGPRVFIRRIILEGYNKVRRKILEREVDINSGDLYKSSLIIDTKRRLFSTGLFKSVRHEIREVKGVYDSVDIAFIVEEVNPRYLRLGFGYHSPLEIQLREEIGHLNLFNNGQRLSLKTDFLFSKSLRRERYDVNYSEPYFLGFRLEGKIHPFYYRDQDKRVREYGFDLQLNKLITPNLRVISALGWKRVESEVEEVGVINSILVQPFWDSRYPILDPQRGFFAYLRTEQAGGPLGGEYDFRRLIYDHSSYHTLKRGITLAWRLRIGYQWVYGRRRSIPAEEKFTLGGEGTVRGYDLHSIGTYYSDIGYSVGNAIFVFNIEYRQKIDRRFGFVLFFDYGGLWKDMKEVSPSRNTGIGAGIGFRFYTPFGPLRFDWGIKLRERSKGDRGRVYLGIGHMF